MAITIGKDENRIIGELAALYKSRGYSRYKLGCFEEYSLYQENKDFLLGKNVITFSDLGGRLMAMRPDVTLSVIRHNDVPENGLEKFFYNEKVYRQSAGSNEYKEINQTGVEAIGTVDEAVIAEITALICETLGKISSDYILDISHMGFTEGLLDEFGSERETLSTLLKKKNLHDFYRFAEMNNFSQKLIDAFTITVNACGKGETVFKEAKKAVLNDKMGAALGELERLQKRMDKFGYGDRLNINFSAVNNADYYNGIIYNGFISGIPRFVLSGGRYDKLLSKLNKQGGAVGFALYLGEIERFFKHDDAQVDCLIIYDNTTQDEALELADKSVKSGKSVRISTVIPAELKYKQLIRLCGEVRK